MNPRRKFTQNDCASHKHTESNSNKKATKNKSYQEKGKKKGRKIYVKMIDKISFLDGLQYMCHAILADFGNDMLQIN